MSTPKPRSFAKQQYEGNIDDDNNDDDDDDDDNNNNNDNNSNNNKNWANNCWL
jgi:hypothetical protein